MEVTENTVTCYTYTYTEKKLTATPCIEKDGYKQVKSNVLKWLTQESFNINRKTTVFEDETEL